MKVITLHNSDFINHCRSLEEAVMADFSPDLVAAIATGGSFVAEQMFHDIPRITIMARRPSTDSKEQLGIAMRIIRALPESLRNCIRIAEARVLRWRGPRTSFDPASIDIEGLRNHGRILVVDDAVDSGATLRAVLGALRKVVPGADIRSAVLTVTTTNPVVRPDFTIYNNHTLLRFPWSKDYRKPADR